MKGNRKTHPVKRKVVCVNGLSGNLLVRIYSIDILHFHWHIFNRVLGEVKRLHFYCFDGFERGSQKGNFFIV